MTSMVRFLAALAASAALVAACQDVPAGPARPAAQDPPSAIIGSVARGLASDVPTAFLSLPPGSWLDAREVVATNTAGGPTIRRPVVDGGFDPLSLPAVFGDIVRVEVVGRDGLAMPILLVPVHMPPVIVRTDPVRRRSSVPLNSRLLVVFSEPIDPATVTPATVRLVVDGEAQPATLELRNGGTEMVVLPAMPLAPSTTYHMIITTGVRDLSGESIVADEDVWFSTAPCDTIDSTAMIQILPDSMVVPAGSWSGFAAVVDSGSRLINHFPDSTVTWRSTDTSIVVAVPTGGIGGVVPGRAWVTAEYRGYIDSALVVVTTWPPPGPFRVFPDQATVPVGHELPFTVSHPEGTPAPTALWSSSDASVVTVTADGVATMVGPGVAWVIATDGVSIDSAQVDVYDPTPPLADRVALYPQSLLLQVGDSWPMHVVGDTPLPTVTWGTTRASVAAVDDRGVVQAVDSGSAVIIATYEDGSRDSADVRVVPAGTLGRIALQPAAASATVGDTVRLAVVFDATAAATYATTPVTWSVQSTGRVLAPVRDGVFTAVGAGTAEVRAFVGPLFTQIVTVTITP